MMYISKAAVKAEIERIDKSIGCDRFLSEYEKGCNQGKEEVCDSLLNFLESLEVKEVDLGVEISLWANAIPEIRLDDIERLAKHFYELGLKAQKGE